MVSVGDIVTVWVKDVDLKRERIGLTMIEPEQEAPQTADEVVR